MSVLFSIYYILSGFFMKISDDQFDIKHNKILSSFFGVLCGIFAGLATVSSPDACVIFLSILIGNAFAFKVDGIHHILSLLVFVIICLIFGIPNISIIALVICVLAALFDELGHEKIIFLTKNIYINLFFEYRCLMKVVVLILCLLGLFDMWTFLYFILFDVSYEVAGYISKSYL